jgi:hypothetical protein
MKNYDYIPRPEVENHYHIRELIERQERRSDDRNYHRNREKERAEREELIKAAPPLVLMDFWCGKCKEDFKDYVYKQVEEDWSLPSQNVAFYKTKCFEGHWCIRLITDKYDDPFWMNSRAIARDRGLHHNDIIQPFETNYNLLYGKR